MSPKPQKTQILKHHRWNFVQRGMRWYEIQELSQKLVSFDGKSLEGQHKNIVGHFVSTDHKHAWLQIWVTIVQTLGLAYTANGGTVLHATDLGRYAAEKNDPFGFYLYWCLRFQFPHGFPKHKHYIDKEVCIQPIILLIEYLLFLKKITGAKDAFLTYEEIINFCMKRSNHDPKKTCEETKKIIENRQKGYNYSEIKSLTGYKTVLQQLASRSKLYLQPQYLDDQPIFTFGNGKISISENKLQLAAILLCFREQPVFFHENTEEARNRYFKNAFDFIADDEIEKIKNAYATRIPPSPSQRLISTELDRELNEEAEDLIKKQKKTKKELIEEARHYVEGDSHKYKLSPQKVRIDDANQKARIKAIEDFSCQIDGISIEYTDKDGRRRRYVEAAHIRGKKLLGNEALDNIIILCPNCHKLLDYGALTIDKEKKVVLKDGAPIQLDHDFHLFISAPVC